MTSQNAETQQHVLHHIERVINRYSANPACTLQILREIQEYTLWISPEVIEYLERRLNVPRTKIEAVAGFYSLLYTEPKGKYRVLFSDNITDRMLGSLNLLDRMTSRLNVERGKLSADKLLSIDTIPSTGMCDQGPALLVNNYAITHLTPSRINQICELIEEEIPLNLWPEKLFEVNNNIQRAGILLNNHFEPGDAIAAALASGQEGWLEQIKHANLRDRSGTGFQTDLKWELCRNTPGDTRYVVGHSDEGEPGTFKDRVLLTTHADAVFEGMTLCAYAVGAKQGFLYLRGEYRYLLEPLNAVLERRRNQSLLGHSILGIPDFDFDIEIHLGAGTCNRGKELSQAASLEENHDTLHYPAFPVSGSYLNQPAAVNNIETLMAACLIARKGAAWFANIGTTESTGTRLLSISGDCERPGTYEYPFGITVNDVLGDCGATHIQAIQINGTADGCITPDKFHRKIAFEDIMTSGSFMVFNSNRNRSEVSNHFTHYEHKKTTFSAPLRG